MVTPAQQRERAPRVLLFLVASVFTLAIPRQAPSSLRALVRAVENNASVASRARLHAAIDHALHAVQGCRATPANSSSGNLTLFSDLILAAKAELALWEGDMHRALDFYCHPTRNASGVLGQTFRVGTRYELGDFFADRGASPFWSMRGGLTHPWVASPLCSHRAHGRSLPLDRASRPRPPWLRVHTIRRALNVSQCQSLIDAAQPRRIGANGSSSSWRWSNHTLAPAQDIPLHSLPPGQVGIFNAALRRTILPALSRHFSLPLASMWVKEAVVIRYTAGGRRARAGVPLHRDNSLLSFNCLLNPPSQFRGGGTRFVWEMDEYSHQHDRMNTSTVLLQRGACVLHCGKVQHEAVPVTWGERLILAGFVEVENVCPAPVAIAEAPVQSQKQLRRLLTGAFGRRQGQAVPLPARSLPQRPGSAVRLAGPGRPEAGASSLCSSTLSVPPAPLATCRRPARPCTGNCTGAYGCLGNELWLVAASFGVASRFGCQLCVQPLLARRLQQQGMEVRAPECASNDTPLRVHAQRGAQDSNCGACRAYGRPDWAGLRRVLVDDTSAQTIELAPYLQNWRFFVGRGSESDAGGAQKPDKAWKATQALFGFVPRVRRQCDAFIAAFKARHRAEDATLITVHVRAGDYARLGAAPPADFFQRAVTELVRARRKGRRHVCALMVSNSHLWLRQNLLPQVRAATNGCAEVVGAREGAEATALWGANATDALDLCVVSRGDDVVIGGGSFGFFAAFLARTAATVTYTTRQFLFGDAWHRPMEYYPPWWIGDAHTDLRAR